MRSWLIVPLAIGATVASAQPPVDVVPPDAAQRITEADAAAVANAVRAGDEALSCEALQTEMVSLAQQIQPVAQGFGQQFEADLAKVEEAQQAAEEQTRRGRPRLGQVARGFATGVIPGADRAAAAAQQAASIAEAEQARVQTNENLERMAAFAGDAAGLAGPARRGERVIALAQARDCAWLKEGGGAPPGAFPAGAFPPGAVPPGIPAAPR
jgi:hypothetical protein